MYVFYALVIIGLVLVWIFLSRYFEKIGQAAEKTTKIFNENLKDIKREEEKENE
ncbi:hypothetical protein [Clostridium cellulovorans]|uniref:ATP synthase F0, B subunit n=1 Tax=Clostridium cellulovorans (strain ATCC 35296 / DSM 3052 / OCM 3 / 743B) TaxID=573061 RepID=D9SV57_CLOC7|nr:hypothetical protein [Clostridium cellulovorans]ADL53031.1 ATP synthase F0, B subunit [Clostridium cellulovorans 743B]